MKSLEIDDIDMMKEENIIQKLAQATARAVDIQLGKTTLAELLDGYTKYIVLQRRIDKAIEYINKLFILEDDNVTYEFKNDEIKPLLNILKGEE